MAKNQTESLLFCYYASLTSQSSSCVSLKKITLAITVKHLDQTIVDMALFFNPCFPLSFGMNHFQVPLEKKNDIHIQVYALCIQR